MIKTCAICGKEFESNVHNKKYCSVECYKKNKNRINKRNYLKNREKYLKYYKQYHLDHREEHIEYFRNYYRTKKEKLKLCKLEHNNCFNCPTEDGECLFDNE